MKGAKREFSSHYFCPLRRLNVTFFLDPMKTILLSVTALCAIFFFFFVTASSGTLTTANNHAHISHADTNIDWEHMSKSERKQYMKDVVMPKMKPIMHDFDAKMFKEVKCVTCHGNGARTGEFKMPNPQLPKLPATREGFDKLNKQHPKVMEFMSKTIKPTMAELLGMKPFDPKTGTGFGCGNCHMTKKK